MKLLFLLSLRKNGLWCTVQDFTLYYDGRRRVFRYRKISGELPSQPLYTIFSVLSMLPNIDYRGPEIFDSNAIKSCLMNTIGSYVLQIVTLL